MNITVTNMKKRQLKPEVIAVVKKDTDLKNAIALALKPIIGYTVTTRTIENYLAKNNPKLCLDDSLKLISATLNIGIKELYDEVPMSDTTTVY